MEENVNDFTQSPIPEFGSSMQPIVQGVLSGLTTIGGGIANIAKKEEEKRSELRRRLELSPDVYDLEQTEIDDLVDGPTGLNETIKKRIDENSFDINKDIDEDLSLRKQSQQIEGLAKISQLNQSYYEEKKAEYLESPEKWVSTDFDAWEKKYTDPSLSILERQKLRLSESPLVEREDVYDLVKRPVWQGFDQERDEKGNFIQYVDEENHASSILRYIQTGKGAKLYDQYKDPNETKENFAKRMANDFNENYFTGIIKHHIPSSRRTGSGRTNTAEWGASPAREDQYKGDPNNYNMITFEAGNRKVTLKDEKGDAYVVSSMYAHYDDAKGKYVIRAQVKDPEDPTIITTKEFSISPNTGEDGHFNYAAIQDVLPPKQRLKDLFNMPIESSAPKKGTTTTKKKANGFPDVDINK